MTPGVVQTCIISQFLALAVCGAGVAKAWDFQDVHDGHTLHVDHASSQGADLDNVKHKQLILPALTAGPRAFTPPEPDVFFLSSTPVQAIHPRLGITQLFPSRASPPELPLISLRLP